MKPKKLTLRDVLKWKSVYLYNFAQISLVHFFVSTTASHHHADLDVVSHVHCVVIVTEEVDSLLVNLTDLRFGRGLKQENGFN